jgi:hypothetical protein
MTDDTAPRSSVWRDRDFVRLWSAGTISVFGSLITRSALPFAAILLLGAGFIEIARSSARSSSSAGSASGFAGAGSTACRVAHG